MTTNAAQPQKQMTEPTLTDREKEIAYLVTNELSDKQIARKLNITKSTVKNHLSSARFKLNVKNRVGLALWYAQNYGFPENKSTIGI